MEQLFCVVELRGQQPADACQRLDAVMAGIGFVRQVPGYDRRSAGSCKAFFQLPAAIYWARRTQPIYKDRPTLIAALDTLGVEYRVVQMTATYWRGELSVVGEPDLAPPIPAVCNNSWNP